MRKLSLEEWKEWRVKYVAERRSNRETIGVAFAKDFGITNNRTLVLEKNIGKATAIILENYVHWKVSELC